MIKRKEKVYNAQICSGGRLRVESPEPVNPLNEGDKFKIVKNTDTFICDNCKKKQNAFEGRFPYEKGWVYLYNFEFKVASNKENPNKDKHFCCKKCMFEFMNTKFEEANKMICLFG